MGIVDRQRELVEAMKRVETAVKNKEMKVKFQFPVWFEVMFLFGWLFGMGSAFKYMLGF